MYKQYLNDYEKKADQIRQAARAIERGTVSGKRIFSNPESNMNVSVKTNEHANAISCILKNLRTDDILLLVLIFVLSTNEDRDMTLIIILGYLFLCGF